MTPTPLRSRSLVRRFSSLALVASALVIAFGSVAPATAATATPTTVTVDPLPTVQINGIVWRQAIKGNTVYATGRFSEARPAQGQSGPTVQRLNLLAYDIRTGQLNTSFAHTLTGGDNPEGRSIAVSPDGKRLYVGGKFTTVDGQARNNFAAFDLTTNQLLPGFTGTDSSVLAVAATSSQVFIGGWFSRAGGASRNKLAAYNADGTLNNSWVANVTGSHVSAMVAMPDKLIVGGSFSKINNATYYSTGAVKLTNGSTIKWASQSSSYRIRMQAPAGKSASALGITSLSTDGKQVYLTAFTYLPGVKHPGSFEGRAAISPTDGKLIWANDCAGDSYDAFPIGKVLYSVSHAHNCSPVGGYKQQDPPNRALAETTYKTGKNGKGMGGNYPSFKGVPRGTILSWFPTMNIGNFSGSNQAAWSVVGTSQYVALGGEFSKVEGVNQQGLVRFGVRTVSPHKNGPAPYTKAGVKAAKANSKRKSKVTITTTSDRDDSVLTYKVYRGKEKKPRVVKRVSSRYWKTTTWSFTDTKVKKGKTAKYRVDVYDSAGNKVSTHN